jgi:hypothetical protein
LKLISYAFNEFVLNDLDASNLNVSTGGGETDRRLSWSSDLYYKRLITVSESGEFILDSRKIKKIQGRDIFSFRKLYAETNKVQTGSSFLFVNNGEIKLTEADSQNSFLYLETPFVFPIEPKGVHNEKPPIDNLEIILQTKENVCSFLQLCFLNDSQKPITITKTMLSFKDSFDVLSLEKRLLL